MLVLSWLSGEIHKIIYIFRAIWSTVSVITDKSCGLVVVTMSCSLLMKLLTTHLLTAPFHTAQLWLHSTGLNCHPAYVVVTTSSAHLSHQRRATQLQLVVKVDNRWRDFLNMFFLGFFDWYKHQCGDRFHSDIETVFEGNWLQQQFSMLCHLSHIGWTAQRGFKFTHLLHAFKSTQSDEWLYFSWGIRGTFFTQTHSNMEGYSRGFLPRGSAAVRTCSQGLPLSLFDSPICLAWSSLFIWLTTAINRLQ